jgi:hypothetical protein
MLKLISRLNGDAVIEKSSPDLLSPSSRSRIGSVMRCASA